MIQARLIPHFTRITSGKSQQLILRPDPVSFTKLRSSSLPGDTSFTEEGGLHQNPCRLHERRTSRSSCRPPEDPKETKMPPRDGSSGHGLGYGSNIAGVINIIAGGPTGGDSQNSRKRTYRQANPDQAEASSRLSEVISYGPSDPVPAASSSHEALVIESSPITTS